MYKLSRRTFLQASLASASALLGNACKPITEPTPGGLRFAVASDGHLGEPNTPSDQFYTELIEALNRDHKTVPLHFVVINGDLIHQGNTHLLPNAKRYLDQLLMPYYVTRGNHDQVSLSTWKQTWGYPTNHVVEHPEATLILLDTSNEAGEYLCGDAVWLREALKGARPNLPQFIFMHIPFIHNAQLTDVCGSIVEVLGDYPGVKAIFHGHDHAKDQGFYYQQSALLFDAHFGSSWGTAYRGYRIVEQLATGFQSYQYDFVHKQQLNSLLF